MRIRMFVVLALAAVACSKGDSQGGADQPEVTFPTLTVDEVDAQLASGAIKPADCNGDPTRKKMGMVPGAITLTSTEYAAAELPADKATKLVFYCANPG
jgi:hypothetical protein